ncbi:hypothetical protein AAE478_007012 [Parahypoxylon ruwenzoriense]
MADNQYTWNIPNWNMSIVNEQAAEFDMGLSHNAMESAMSWFPGQDEGFYPYHALQEPMPSQQGHQATFQGWHVQQPSAEGSHNQQQASGGAQLIQPILPAFQLPHEPVSGAGDQAVAAITQQESHPDSVPAHLREPNWTYAVEVSPAADERGRHAVTTHILAVQEALEKKGIEFGLVITSPVEEPLGLCRQYSIPQSQRYNDRFRLEFLQVFSTNRPFNQALAGYRFKMSVVYENRPILRGGSYPAAAEEADHGVGDLIGFPVDDPPMLSASPESPGILNMSPSPERHASPAVSVEKNSTSPPSVKGISKPTREVVKNDEGKFVCTFPGCVDGTKGFGRKCEWSKHMDKHDRPYKCPTAGCENLPGFTYSGGLLRHEREVHGKHGGPKNPLNCPHVNCKRHTGKGFSRLENLNEHLRRVHTPGNSAPPSGEDEPEEYMVVRSRESVATRSPGSAIIGVKRKPDGDLRDKVKRLQIENTDLRSQVEAQKRQQIAMMQQMQALQEKVQILEQAKANTNAAVNANGSAPRAPATVS